MLIIPKIKENNTQKSVFWVFFVNVKYYTNRFIKVNILLHAKSEKAKAELGQAQVKFEIKVKVKVKSLSCN